MPRIELFRYCTTWLAPGDPIYEAHDHRPRQIRTTIGKVKITWQRLRCRRCGHTMIPLREFLGLNPHQSKTLELEKLVAEIISEQNYRRGSAHLKMVGGIPVPKSTAHRWVSQSDCAELEPADGKLHTLFADGTGYKRRPEPEKGLNNQGEVRVALGVTPRGQVVPVGAWSGSSWEEIGQEIGDKAGSSLPMADILVSDGELGLAAGLANLTDEQQRCQWHLVRDYDVYLWNEDVSRTERRVLQGELAGIIGIELPKEDFEMVPVEDKKAIEERLGQAEKGLQDLIQRLEGKKYWSAARYIQRAKERIFTYVRFWLRFGIISPRASSWIERMMRELGRRLKKMAFGWSERGAAKMAKIIIKRFVDPEVWKRYWEKKLRIEGNAYVIFRRALDESLIRIPQ